MHPIIKRIKTLGKFCKRSKLFIPESTHKGVNWCLKNVTQVQQQRPELPTVTLTWHAYKCKVYKLHQWYIFIFLIHLFLSLCEPPPLSQLHKNCSEAFTVSKLVFYTQSTSAVISGWFRSCYNWKRQYFADRFHRVKARLRSHQQLSPVSSPPSTPDIHHMPTLLTSPMQRTGATQGPSAFLPKWKGLLTTPEELHPWAATVVPPPPPASPA